MCLVNQTHFENRRFRAADLTPPAPLSLDIFLAHAGKENRLRARGEESHLYRGSEPPRSKTIVLAQMGKEDVEGEGGWG